MKRALAIVTFCLVVFVTGTTSWIQAQKSPGKDQRRVVPEARLLPERLGLFRARPVGKSEESSQPATEPASQSVEYTGPNGQIYEAAVTNLESESAAYARLSDHRKANLPIKLGEIGTASITAPNWVAFYKGKIFVRISSTRPSASQQNMVEFARALAQTLPSGDSDIPVLLKHLPDWLSAQPNASYLVSLDRLKQRFPDQTILEALSFEGGAEAVVAPYDSGELVIIEFTTPQLAGDNDRRIKAKLDELRGIAQSITTVFPTAYKRVGNYSVFVFNGRNEQTAAQLIDQVRYEQVVQWLGDNPYPLLEAQRRYTETTLGVFLAVVKASGLALLVCLTAGGLFGALLFYRRRAQQRTVEAFSDAGGMLRLNLDDMTPQTDARRLLGPGN